MSLRRAEIAPVPAATAQVAAAAFPKGCPAMRMRDALGTVYDDRMFASLYPAADTVGEITGWSRQAAMSWTKREVRVAARGLPRNHASRRARFRAAAVATCCKWVLARPM